MPRIFLTTLVVLLAGGTIAHAQQQLSNPPSLVLLNGHVLTMDPESKTVEALAVRDGRIVAVGDSATIRSMAGSDTRTIDLAGKTVVPGLIDQHGHFRA